MKPIAPTSPFACSTLVPSCAHTLRSTTKPTITTARFSAHPRLVASVKNGRGGTSRLPVPLLICQVHLPINARLRQLRTYQVHELLLAMHIELRVNVLGVAAHGVLCQVQRFCDVGLRAALAQHLHHLKLARR